MATKKADLDQARASAALAAARIDHQQKASPQAGTVGGQFGLQKTSSVPEFIEADVRGTRRRIPSAVYDLPAAQQRQFFDDLEAREKEKEGASYFDNVALAVLDRVEAMGRRITSLEADRDADRAEISDLKQQLAEVNTTIQVKTSEAQAEAESRQAQLVINLQAVGASQEADHRRRMQETDQKIVELHNVGQVVEQPVKELLGTLQSGAQVYRESINATQADAADVRQQLVVTQRDQTELGGDIEANRRTLRAIQGKDLNQMVDEAVRNLFNTSVIKEKVLGWVRGAFTPAAPSTSIDVLDPRPIEMTPNISNDSMEQEVRRALRKGGRR